MQQNISHVAVQGEKRYTMGMYWPLLWTKTGFPFLNSLGEQKESWKPHHQWSLTILIQFYWAAPSTENIACM